MIRPSLHHQGIPPSFLAQQHGPSTPSQPHNLNLLPGANQSMSFLQNPPNGPFANHQLARIQSDNRRRDIHSQSQRATAGGAQTPSVMNGVLPAQPSGVGYAGIVPQNGQVPAHRVVSQPVGVGGPLTPSHPSSHPGNPGLGLNGGLQTPRSVSQSQSHSQMGVRPGQTSLPGQANVGQTRQPPVGMPGIPSGTGVRGSAGMGVNMTGMIGNVPQQTPSQQGFPSPRGMGGPGPQPPPQGPQGPATSMSQPMHRTISTPEGANSFGGMPGFAGGPFSQAGPHPPASHLAGPNSSNQFSFMPPSSSPSQPIDMHSLSSGGAGPSSTSPTRSDFTMTPAQVASLQYGSGGLSGSSGNVPNDTFPPTFTTMPPHPPQRPPSSSHSAPGLAPQQAPTAQGLSHPTPPRQQTPLQQPQVSQTHLPDRLSAPIPNPTRPQSQPQRPSSQQQAGRSPTPRMPPGTLHPNAMLLQGHPTSITGASAPPPQPRPVIGSVGPPPLNSASSTENGDLSRQPGIRASMPRFVCSQWSCRVRIFH
jgi:hypothetical protein